MRAVDIFFLAMVLATFAAPFVLVAEIILAMRRRTRYFAVPLFLGLASGVAMMLRDAQGLRLAVFLAGFGIVALPVGVIFGVVAVFDWLHRISATAVPKVLLVLFALAITGIAVTSLDQPSDAASGEIDAYVTSMSTGVRDGKPYRIAEITLPDGDRETARVAEDGEVPMFTGAARVKAYRRLITRRNVYEVVGKQER